MITREELDEMERIIRDYRMTMDYQEHMDNNEPFVILPTSTPMTVVFTEAQKTEIKARLKAGEKKIRERMDKFVTPTKKTIETDPVGK